MPKCILSGQKPKLTEATIAVGTVTTGEAGTSASVTNSGTSSAAVFNFTIPRGAKGDKGDTGDAGPAGVAGQNATINGVNALTISAGENIELEQSGSTLTISASGGGALYVNVSGSGQGMSTSHSAAEIYTAFQAGRAVFCVWQDMLLPALTITATASVFACSGEALTASVTILDTGSSSTVYGSQGAMPASSIGFDPAGSGLTADNVQDAIEEVASASESTTVTLLANSWASSGGRYSQTVSVSFMTVDMPVVTVDASLTGTDLDADAQVLEAWLNGPAGCNVTQSNGSLTFYALQTPTINIPVNVGVS